MNRPISNDRLRIRALEEKLRVAYRQNRSPAHRDLATGGPDEVANRKPLVPDSEKWGARFEELVQLTGRLER